MSSRVILVTGANGQLGREMQRVAQHDLLHSYIFTDRVELDISNGEAVKSFVEENGVSVIVNCAAYTNVDGAEDDFEGANMINNLAVCNLADAAKSVGALLVHISTDYVFDGKGVKPYKESDATAPIGVYGKTKLAGEMSIMDIGCRYIIIRTSWLFSVWGGNFVKTMLRLTTQREEVGVVADQLGKPTFAGDLASAVMRVIESSEENEILHFSCAEACSWYDFAVAICDLSGNDCVVRAIGSDDFESRVERPRYSVLDCSKFERNYGVVIPSWRESLSRCVEELKGAKIDI